MDTFKWRKQDGSKGNTAKKVKGETQILTKYSDNFLTTGSYCTVRAQASQTKHKLK